MYSREAPQKNWKLCISMVVKAKPSQPFLGAQAFNFFFRNTTTMNANALIEKIIMNKICDNEEVLPLPPLLPLLSLRQQTSNHLQTSSHQQTSKTYTHQEMQRHWQTSNHQQTSSYQRLNHQPSTINHQPSTINHQPSTINRHPPISKHQAISRFPVIDNIFLTITHYYLTQCQICGTYSMKYRCSNKE